MTVSILDELEALRFPDVRWDERDRPVLVADGRVLRVRTLDSAVIADAAYAVGLNQRDLDRLATRLRTASLRMYDSHAADLAGLARVGPLKRLVIEWFTNLASLDPVGELAGLEVLSVVDTPKTRDLEPFGNLRHLRALEYAGGIWSKNTALSLEPIGRLAELEELRLANLAVLDGGLRPLAGCRALRRLDVSNQFPTTDYAYLSVKLPETACDLFAPYVRLDHPIDDNDVMVVGSRKPFLNSTRDAARLRRYVEEFQRLKEAVAVNH